MKKLKRILSIDEKEYHYYSLKEARENGLESINKLPRCLSILLENVLRKYDDPKGCTSWKDILAFNDWVKNKKSEHEISFYPTRVLMQDLTGVPAVVDLAIMRDEIESRGGDPQKINPTIPVDLVIDHSVQVESFGNINSFKKNIDIEYQRNEERYSYLKWATNAFSNFRVVPPNTGIVHQVNLEYFAKVIWTSETEHDEKIELTVYPDTCIGTDSHTTMINGLSVLGWGVGGIEAEAAMLGQPISMIIPEVIGFKLIGKLNEGVTATDLVLTITKKLRQYGVVEKFIEFVGNGVKALSLTDRATLANMAPEYGATCAYFPIDEKTIDYLKLTGRDHENIKLVEAYAKEQGLWAFEDEDAATYTDIIELNLKDIAPCVAGPKRPQDKIEIDQLVDIFAADLVNTFKIPQAFVEKIYSVEKENFKLGHGSIVIAAITSCTNTSNPAVMIAAGLLAQNAVRKGMTVPPWVKTSLAPGSQVVTDYLVESRLQEALDTLGFHLVGYGCTTCIGNSGPLSEEISETINKNNLVATAILSGNRNFEGRINPDVQASYLASPPLVVAYALAGTMKIDLTRDPIGVDKNGEKVYLKDLWPTSIEIEDLEKKHISSDMFKNRYSKIFTGDKKWLAVNANKGIKYKWNSKSTYIKSPPFFDKLKKKPNNQFKIKNARILALLGDSITTDHISPAGTIPKNSPAGCYLMEHAVRQVDFNTYGSRRGNYEVMTRGTFANIRIKNQMLDGIEGGRTKYIPTGQQMSIYDAAMEYRKFQTPVIVIAGKEYGSGSSRDWAAKGTKLLGIKSIIATSFERIHRSNLIGMGVMPFQFPSETTYKSLMLNGDEIISIQKEIENYPITCKGRYKMMIKRIDGSIDFCWLTSRIDTEDELRYFMDGGILDHVLKRLSLEK